MLVDFYREIGFLPDAMINYLLLLGWSLDDQTEDFSRQQMIELFSLERVVKSEASFDPEKLLVFQQRYMNDLPLKQKVALCLPYLQRAGLVADPAEAEMGAYLAAIIQAADDRITVAGDILNFDDFFVADEELQFDSKAFQKRLVKPADAGELLAQFSQVVGGQLDELYRGALESTAAPILRVAADQDRPDHPRPAGGHHRQSGRLRDV